MEKGETLVQPTLPILLHSSIQQRELWEEIDSGKYLIVVRQKIERCRDGGGDNRLRRRWRRPMTEMETVEATGDEDGGCDRGRSPVAAATAVFLIYPIGQGSFSDVLCNINEHGTRVESHVEYPVVPWVCAHQFEYAINYQMIDNLFFI
ncbi:Photosynthetic reaction centre, L/M [Cynara cardunculus var. scolymus]|uniref:Photosynthetic reaction centre, L/M n=1 Tax=Cynara cardunculus var. scolymus TaxID=59895 RepID=A0A118JVR1_CYNCS|nr:Photosynthetic reaction centre, L/M [Cynara cardunculus var. scolymus]